MPDVVVIVTYNSAKVLPGCLDSLDAGFAGLEPPRVVVVDNASSDGSLELAAQHRPDALLVQTGRNGGYAAAINAGIAAVGTVDDVLVLNPDVRLRPGSVAALQRALRDSGAGIAVPRLINDDGTTAWSLRRDPSVTRQLGEAVLGGTRAGRRRALGEMITDPTAYERAGWVDWATGAAMLISRGCREAVGAWDESFFLYSEETDYCQRARRAGFAVRYVPEAVMSHSGGELETSPELYAILVRNKLRLFSRGHGPLRSAVYRGALTLNEFLRAARGSRVHRRGLRVALRGDQLSAPPGVVIFSAQDYWYHNRAHSDVQLARGFAATRPVLLVNSIGMRMPTARNTVNPWRRVARKLRSTTKALRTPEPGLHVLSPVILPFYGSPLLRRLNAALVRLQVRAACAVLSMRRPHVVVTIPTAADVVASMPRSSLVVNRSDRYSAFPESDQQLMRSFEHRLLADAELAVYVSHELMNEEAPLVGGRSYFVGHGVDYQRFAEASLEPPADIAAIPHPRIGFFGGIDDYIVDVELIGQVADALPDAHVVLIGDATCPMDELTARPNVHWLGYRDYSVIPAYGAAFDVALMPWLQNEWSRHCNPIKAKEYLALGLPVVTTYYPESESLQDVMAIAHDREEFVELVRKALSGSPTADPHTRRAAVRGDSWRSKADELLALADAAGGS